MSVQPPSEPLPDQTALDNAIVGHGTIVEPGVIVGYRYHQGCGAARIGANGILHELTTAPLDLWHPLLPDLEAIDWPEDWGRRTHKE